MEIKQNMYVRTNQGQIFQIEEIEVTYYCRIYYVKETGVLPDDYLLKEEIKKASFNLIDLIEFGDFVNGQVVEKYRGKLGMFLIYENCWKFETIENYIKENKLLGIVTKEQFNSIEYEV